MVMELSIVVLTMNRAEQLIEALESCVACNLPQEMEFVIINNGSTDDTPQRIEAFQRKYPDVPIRCHFSPENLGVSGGRDLGYSMAQGRFVYFLDDDAIIDPACRETFFTKSLDFFRKNPQAASLTTAIYDEMLQYDRDVTTSDKTVGGLHCIFMFLGGSHFLRKSAFSTPLYFNIPYGNEEFAPSIAVQDKGYCHVYAPELRVIHKPKVNKWVNGSSQMRWIVIHEMAVVYATKYVLYPVIFRPVLWLGYRRRCAAHLKCYDGARQEADALTKQLRAEFHCRKIHSKTVWKMAMQFGSTVF